MDNFRVTISDRAAEQLNNCVLFIAEKDVDASERLKATLIEAIISLQRFPSRFPFFNEEYVQINKYHKMVVEKRYIILYQIKDSTVYVDHVIDCRRNYKWLII